MSASDRQAIQSFYDEESERYFATRYEGDSADNLVWRARAQIVLELVGTVPGLAVDLGCGPGVLAPMLAQRSERVLCADLSLGMLRAGRRALGDARNVDWVNCDLSHVPLAAGSVEALLVIGVFGLAPDPPAALREFARVVRPGGRLILQVPNAYSPRRFAERTASALARPAAYEARLAQSGIGPRPHSPRTIERMMCDAAFEPRRRRYYDFRAPWLSRLSPRLDAGLASALQRRLAARSRLGLLAEGLVVEAVRR